MNRRSFLRTAAVGAALAPVFSLRSRAGSPGARANLAFIGVGGYGRYAPRNFAEENLVAFCDINELLAAETFSRFPQVPRFNDFRRMLDKFGQGLDGVVVATPNHSHYPIAVEVLQRGLNIYLEKPLAHTVWEAKKLRELALRAGVVHQMGNHGHAFGGIRSAVEWVRAGVLGEIREVHAWTNRRGARAGAYPPPGDAVPATLDWNAWLGPLAFQEYSPEYVRDWRFWWDFGNGALGDMGCHTLDAPFWALDLGAPSGVSVTPGTVDPHYSRDGSVVEFTFPDRNGRPMPKVTWYEPPHLPPVPAGADKDFRLANQGLLIVGSDATLYAQGPRCDGPQLLGQERWREFRGQQPPQVIPRIKGTAYEEWLNAIKGAGPRPQGDFDYGARLSEMVLLGALAIRTGQSFQWDSAAQRVTDRSGWENLIKPSPRQEWRHYYES